MIESFGVPHVEIDLVLVNGLPVGFDYLVCNGDWVYVLPPLDPISLDIPRFIADVHIKTLARRLRMLGFDTLYSRTLADHKLAEYSKNEDRVLLSRDTQLLMRNAVTRGLYIRSTHPPEQVLEVIKRFNLLEKITPLSRCILCNGEIASIQKGEIPVNAIPPAVRERTDAFCRCNGCGKYYWKGSHVDRMLKILSEIRQALA